MNEITDYTQITESPGLKASKEQIERLYQRYHFAREFAKDKNVLEVACGSGIGLGYLAETACKVVGGDIEEKNLAHARDYYQNGQGKICVDLIDAHNLPFQDKSFGLVLLYEAIYYLQDPGKFISEAARVLQKDGILIIGTVNKEWEDFHPSPYTHKYFSAEELYGLVKDKFSDVKLYGAFPVDKGGVKNSVVSIGKRMAVDMNLIPGSLKARAYLKRIFMGKLAPIPNEVYEDMAPYTPPEEMNVGVNSKGFKIIYLVSKK